MRLDMNADLGEHDGPPRAADLEVLDVVTSVNVACGAHAGDDASMRLTARAAAERGVQVGAHPSFPDREGFGRRVLPLLPDRIANEVARQVHRLIDLAAREGVPVRHVKPHGALYNLAWRNDGVAEAIARAVATIDAGLALYAPQGSALAAAGAAAGLRVFAEGFLDRAYEDDGSLTPREVAGAVLHDVGIVSARALAWVRTGRVVARSGLPLPMGLETLCVHGDSPGAAAMAAATRAALESAGVRLLPSLAPPEARA